MTMNIMIDTKTAVIVDFSLVTFLHYGTRVIWDHGIIDTGGQIGTVILITEIMVTCPMDIITHGVITDLTFMAAGDIMDRVIILDGINTLTVQNIILPELLLE